MVRLTIHGFTIDMPYTPYPAQIISISKILESLKSSSSSLIESPTGTGKTLSILCSIISYLSSQNSKQKNQISNLSLSTSSSKENLRIFVCSRTHKQIDQLIKCLKKLRPNIKASILASRNQLCINPTIRNVADKNTACLDLLKQNRCKFFSKKEDLAKKLESLSLNSNSGGIFDIEDLKKAGTKCGGCPFYASKTLIEQSSVIFAPYNYLVDPKIRTSLNIDIKNSVIIIDEAHNIEDFCRSAGNLNLGSSSIDAIYNEMGKVLKGPVNDEFRKEIAFVAGVVAIFKRYGEQNERFAGVSDFYGSGNVVDLKNIKEKDISFTKIDDKNLKIEFSNSRMNKDEKFSIKRFAPSNTGNITKKINTVVEPQNKKEKLRDFIKKGKDIVTFLNSINITPEIALKLKRSTKEFLGSESVSQLTVQVLEQLVMILETIFFGNSEAYAFSFVQKNNNTNFNKFTQSQSNKQNDAYSLDFYLLDPSLIFLPLARQCQSIVLLSGTLQPFDSFISELGHFFSHKIETPHIINKENAFIATIRKGHLGSDILGTYTHTENYKYINQVNHIILSIQKNVGSTGGTLVFVPSYSFLDTLVKKMNEKLALNSNSNKSYIHSEPRNNRDFDKIMEKYKNDIEKKKSPVFICVYRGRAAEGTDFKDEFARAVVCIGIPYPSFKDKEVVCKREFNDTYKSVLIRKTVKNTVPQSSKDATIDKIIIKGGNNTDSNEVVSTLSVKRSTGSEWYETQAFRAVNQAIGRVIRHKKDWGGVFLIDMRYSEKRNTRMMPKWVNSNVKVYENSELCMTEFKTFVEDKKMN